MSRRSRPITWSRAMEIVLTDADGRRFSLGPGNLTIADAVDGAQRHIATPTDVRSTRIAELASLQRYTALPEGWRQVAEDQHIAESSYPHPAPMVVVDPAERAAAHRRTFRGAAHELDALRYAVAALAPTALRQAAQAMNRLTDAAQRSKR